MTSRPPSPGRERPGWRVYDQCPSTRDGKGQAFPSEGRSAKPSSPVVYDWANRTVAKNDTPDISYHHICFTVINLLSDFEFHTTAKEKIGMVSDEYPTGGVGVTDARLKHEIIVDLVA